MQSQLNLMNFYNWFAFIGGELSNFKVEEINQSVNQIQLNHSNLKPRAEEIKRKYNHVFKFKNQ